jgi:hypothetical protein
MFITCCYLENDYKIHPMTAVQLVGSTELLHISGHKMAGLRRQKEKKKAVMQAN